MIAKNIRLGRKNKGSEEMEGYSEEGRGNGFQGLRSSYICNQSSVTVVRYIAVSK